jgi:hypothetical protein
MKFSRRRFLVGASAVVVSACAPQASRPGDGLVPLYANPARNEWPEEFLRLPAETQAMYRYAAVNRDTLRYMPCFCGCVAGGHRDNFDCYVREVMPDGRVRLDTMSFG